MSPAPIDFSAINTAALADSGFLQRLLPGGRFEGNEYVVRNPIRADGKPGSFKINRNTGVWADFATGDRGGDFIDLYKYVRGLSDLGDAARELAEMVHSSGRHQKRKPAAAPDDWVPITPIPPNAPPLHAEKFCPSGFQHTKTWEFRDRTGQLHQCVARFGRPNGVPGKKTFSPFTYCRGPDGIYAWRQKALPENRPLYGLPELADRPAANVVIVEGEKTADAAAKVFPQSCVITWSGGSNAVSKTDWSPLAGRQRVLLTPDKDDPGRKAMRQVGSILAGLGIPDIKIVDAESLAALTPGESQKVLTPEPGWDLANALEEGWHPEQLRKAVVRLAKPFDTRSYASRPSVRLISAADIKPEPIQLDLDRLAGEGQASSPCWQALGWKNNVGAGFSCPISRGGTFPDGQRAQTGNVLIWSGEDGIKDTLVPRLMVAKAELSRIQFVGETIEGSKSRAFDPAVDMPLLVEAAERLGDVELLILDPIVSSIQGDSHKNAEVRRGLQPIVDFCERAGCAAIGITHLSKGTQGQDPIDRITGSLAFGAVARVALIKSNIGPDGGGFFYEIKETLEIPAITTSKIEWLGVAEGSARDIIGCAEETQDPEKRSALDEAVAFLRETLADTALPAAEVIGAAKKVGISERTLNRAKSRAGVKAFKQAGLGGKGHWMWWLTDPANFSDTKLRDQGTPYPNQDDQGCQDCQPREFGNVGNLADQVGQEGQGCQPQNLGNLGNLALSEGENGRLDDGEPMVEVEI